MKLLLKHLFLNLIIISAISAQQKIKIIKAAEVETIKHVVDISGYCSLGCAMGWEFEVSSSLESAGSDSYDPDKIEDGLVSTAWIEGKYDYGIGEFIKYKFHEKYFNEGGIKDSINLDGFQIVNGYCKSKKIYEDNSRVRKLRLYLNSTSIYIILVNDSMTIQEITFEKPIFIKPNDEIKLEIMEVYEGKKYKDTAISELLPKGAH